jgi:hypothetical protein
MSYELAEQYAEFEAPQVEGMSKSFVKTMVFAQTAKLTNADIDYYMAQRPMRHEDETSEQFKMRSKFAKALYKYRQFLYDYSVFEKQN